MKTIRPLSAQRSFIRRFAAIVGILLAAALVLLGATSSSAVEPLNALVPITVEVPLALRDFPFDHDRVLMVPAEFKILSLLAFQGQDSSCPSRPARFLWRNQGLEAFSSFGLKPTVRWVFPP
jgi:hypothetical protein